MFTLLKCTRWFRYDRDDLCVNKSQFVLVILEPPYILFILGGHYVVLCKPVVSAELFQMCSLLQTCFQHYNLKIVYFLGTF
jgi:hypothetical protein